MISLIISFLIIHATQETRKTIFLPFPAQKFNTFFPHVPFLPEDPLVVIEREFQQDPSPEKVNLGIGDYKDEYGKTYVFPSIRDVEREMLDPDFVKAFYVEHNITDQMPSDGLFDKNYLPPLGFEYLYKTVERLMLGKIYDDTLSFHTTSSTTAFGVVLNMLERFANFSSFALSIPTFYEYEGEIKNVCPDKKILYYRYVEKGTTKLDIENLLVDLKSLPDGTVVVLQAGCHNPTGIDPTLDEWKRIAEVFRSRRLFPLLDAAYLGFVSGDFEKDSEIIRLFKDLGIELAITGLYGERVGTGHIVTSGKELVANMSSQVARAVGKLYLSPPVHGSRVAYFVFDKHLEQWKGEVKKAVDRIKGMRKTLVEKLEGYKIPYDFTHILDENGMFTMLPFNQEQVERFKTDFHCYMAPSDGNKGRVSIAGLNMNNVDHVAESIYEVMVCKNQKEK